MVALDLQFYKTFGNFSVISNLNIFCISKLDNLSQKTGADCGCTLTQCKIIINLIRPAYRGSCGFSKQVGWSVGW